MIKLINVSRIYPVGSGGVKALRDVNLHIRPNDYLAIIGPSGSGKSTMLHLLGLLDKPTQGQILFQDQNVAELSDKELSRLRGRSIGFVFQSFHLISHLSVMENVELPLLYQGVPPWQRRVRVEAQLAAVSMSHRARHFPVQLSGGEAQRVAIARALATDPSLILADEPTGNLDTKNGAEIMTIFDDLRANGKTIVMITHDPSIAARLQRVVRIIDGLIVEETAR